MRAAFDGEFSSHAGEAWEYDEVGIAPRPVQHHLPVWVGGSTEVALRRAADARRRLGAVGPARGRDVRRHRPPARLREEAGRVDEPFTVGARRGRCTSASPAGTSGRAVHGSPEQVAGFLRVLAGLGVDQIEVAFRSRDVHELYDQICGCSAPRWPRVV